MSARGPPTRDVRSSLSASLALETVGGEAERLGQGKDTSGGAIEVAWRRRSALGLGALLNEPQQPSNAAERARYEQSNAHSLLRVINE